MSSPTDPPDLSSSRMEKGRWPARVQGMLDLRRLREHSARSAEVSAVWRKAVQSARDAELRDISVDGSLRAAYDAGHMACLSLLAAHGLRPGGGHGHHEIAFAGAAALGDPALLDLVPESEEVRGLRRGSMYDPTIADVSDRDRALEWMRRTLPAIRAALVAAEPTLRDFLDPYP